MSYLVKLSHLSKQYQMGDIVFHVLKDLNLTININDFLAIVGASGSGKSTLMNILGCLDKPTTGDYFFQGENVNDFSANKLAMIRNQKIGFIFQAFFLLPKLSALENVMLPLFYRGIDRHTAKKAAENMLAKVNIHHVMHHKPYELSGGQQQRVAIARALICNPEMILADEPTGALDSKTGNEILSLLKNIHQTQNKTIVIITHDPLISAHCEKVITMQDGCLIHN